MRVVDKDLMAMKVNELKEELEARSEATSGSKAWLRRRLQRGDRARVPRDGHGGRVNKQACPTPGAGFFAPRDTFTYFSRACGAHDTFTVLL